MSKILIIEDEVDIRESLEQVLTIEGYEVIAAENGRVGLEKAKKNLPELIFCDINMPELDGYEVISELRNHKETQTIPFIFLTARADRNDLRKGMNLGADDYLNKPFTLEELKNSIAARLAKSKIVKEKEKEKIDALRNSISMSMPHELKTPLNGIIGFAEVFVNEINTLEKNELVEMANYILENARRLDKTIEKYLLYAHLQFLNSNADLLSSAKKSSTNLDVNLVTNIVSIRANSYNRLEDLTLDLTPALLKIHPEYLKIIIEQIGNNCFDYSYKGSHVNISSQYNESSYILFFKDEGRGLTEKQISEIGGGFTQFERTIYEQQGTGMGLAISKRIVEMFGGKFVVKSELKKGTTVTIELPISNNY
ncbi:MAG: hybrid sensor histidine kinase/response regulator [Melioribacteraceae bacterium]